MEFIFKINGIIIDKLKFLRSKRNPESFYDNLLKEDSSANKEIYKHNRKNEIKEDITIIISYGILAKILNILFLVISIFSFQNIMLFSIFIGISVIFLISYKLLFKWGIDKKNYGLDPSEMFIDMLFDLEKL